MITNFEEITKDLSKEDYLLIPSLLQIFESRTRQNPIKAPEIVNEINANNPNLKTKFSEVKLRKLANFIRAKGMIGLIATSNGYFSTKKIAEILMQIKSLNERAEAINNSAKGLYIVIERIKTKI